MISLEELQQAIVDIDINDLSTIDKVIVNGVKPKNWKGIVLHHSYKPDVPRAGVDYAKIFNDYHYGLGWMRGLGYQFVITWNAENPSAPIRVQASYRWVNQCVGSHSLNRKKKDLMERPNEDAIGICFVGNFDSIVLPIEVYIQAKKLITYLRDKYNIPSDKVLGHYSLDFKSCPGRRFDIDFFRR